MFASVVVVASGVLSPQAAQADPVDSDTSKYEQYLSDRNPTGSLVG